MKLGRTAKCLLQALCPLWKVTVHRPQARKRAKPHTRTRIHIHTHAHTHMYAHTHAYAHPHSETMQACTHAAHPLVRPLADARTHVLALTSGVGHPMPWPCGTPHAMAVWDTPCQCGVGHPRPWRCGTPHAMAVWDTPCHGGVGHPMPWRCGTPHVCTHASDTYEKLSAPLSCGAIALTYGTMPPIAFATACDSNPYQCHQGNTNIRMACIRTTCM